jgi:hypothetical protein
MTESWMGKPDPLLSYVCAEPVVGVIRTVNDEIDDAAGIEALKP